MVRLNRLQKRLKKVIPVLILGCFFLYTYKDWDGFWRYKSTGKQEWPWKKSKSFSAYDPLQPCTHQILRDYYKDRNAFPGDGVWDSTSRNSYFRPAICSLENRTLSSEDMKTCLGKLTVQRIVILGDSNGKRYFDAILEVMRLAYPSCVLEREEQMMEGGFRPEPAYFSLGDEHLEGSLLTAQRLCKSCASRRYMCKNQDSELYLEHISLAQMLDDSLTVPKPHPMFSETFQEFLFKNYLRKIIPDILIIFPPFNHMKHRGIFANQKLSISYFSDLVDKHLPHINVFWIPSMGENEDKKPDKWRNVKMLGMDSTQRIDILNRELFDAIAPKLVESESRQFGFFDLLSLSTFQSHLNIDGVHMDPIWYERIVNIFFQVMCNDPP